MEEERELHIEDYPDLLKDLHFSSDEIKDRLSDVRLEFLPQRNEKVERGIAVPLFVPAFYDCIRTFGYIPDSDEAFGYYLDFSKEEFRLLQMNDLIEDLKARFLRTYPSIMRDFHFNKYLSENLPRKYQVIYNPKLDYEEGIDLLIKGADTFYGFCFFTDTPRGNSGRLWKQKRHVYFSNVVFLEQALDLSAAEHVPTKGDDFLLYGKAQFDAVVKLLTEQEALRSPALGGYCIRCGKQIPRGKNLRFYQDFYCESCLKDWSKYANVNYRESHCHFCGKKVSGRDYTSASHPICRDCWHNEGIRYI